MFKLILLSPETFSVNEIPQLCAMMRNGLRIFHLRKPEATKKQLRSYLQQIPAGYRKRIVLHQHFSLCGEFTLKGIHLNEKEKKQYAKYARRYKIISASFHEINALEENHNKYEYVFLSPVFDSISKKNYIANKSLLKDAGNYPGKQKIIALGGINKSNLKKAKEAGFSGVAFLGAVWHHKHPVQSWKMIRQDPQEKQQYRR